MRILRRLFVVPLAEDNHGKTHIMNALLTQALGTQSPGRKGQRFLRTPSGRRIDGLIFVRSYQETEKNQHDSVEVALDAEDSGWRRRELIIMPSHLEPNDVNQMVESAHANGFDVVAASIILRNAERRDYSACWRLGWDERWNLPNPRRDNGWEAQADALGRDLWFWISGAMIR